ncbi:MAG TPA: hypothetical protein VF406_04550 [Thermodesulfobacteriota bacterium]
MATQTTMPGVEEPYSEEAALAQKLRAMASECLQLAEDNADSASSTVRQVAAFAADAAGKILKAANNIDKVLTRARA